MLPRCRTIKPFSRGVSPVTLPSALRPLTLPLPPPPQPHLRITCWLLSNHLIASLSQIHVPGKQIAPYQKSSAFSPLSTAFATARKRNNRAPISQLSTWRGYPSRPHRLCYRQSLIPSCSKSCDVASTTYTQCDKIPTRPSDRTVVTKITRDKLWLLRKHYTTYRPQIRCDSKLAHGRAAPHHQTRSIPARTGPLLE